MKDTEIQKDRLRRLILSFVFGRVAQRGMVIVIAVFLFFALFLITRSLYDAMIAGLITYIISIITLIILDIVHYYYATPDKVVERVLSSSLRTIASNEKRNLLREEFDLRLRNSHLKKILTNEELEWGLPQTVIDQLDEAIRISRYLKQRLEEDPTATITIHAVQVTRSEADEELNFWRSLKAVQYLAVQRELLETGRVNILRFFITEPLQPRDLNLKALAVIANHRYWGIRTAWGMRGHCSLPLATGAGWPSAADPNKPSSTYLNTLLVSFDGKLPFKVAVLGETPQEGEIYNDVFRTYWSFYDISGREPYSVHLWNELHKAVLELEQGAITEEHPKIIEMDDLKIDGILKEKMNDGDDYAKGYYAFRRVRNEIPKAQKVTAIDVTSVKRTFSILRQNPGYLEWQDACFRQIKEGRKDRMLRRCYLIDPTKTDTVDNFVQILNEYFIHFGNVEVLPDNVSIYYISIDKVRSRVLLDMSAEDVRDWLNHKVVNVKTLCVSAQNPAMGTDQLTLEEERLLLFRLIARDVLYTESFIYDYINPDAKVDQTGTGDYKYIENNTESNYEAFKTEYDRIFNFLRDHCGKTQVKNLRDVDPALIRQNLTPQISLRAAANSPGG